MTTKHFVLGILLSSVGFLKAQQVTKTDTLHGTPLSMTMDSKVLSALENMEENCKKTPSRKNENSTETSRVLVANRPLTTAEICSKNPRISGYKIQVAIAKSNEEANEIKAYFRRRFPRLKVETDASLRPNYKILAGSYFTKSSASGDLAQIRTYFKDAIAIQKMIFCVEGK